MAGARAAARLSAAVFCLLVRSRGDQRRLQRALAALRAGNGPGIGAVVVAPMPGDPQGIAALHHAITHAHAPWCVVADEDAALGPRGLAAVAACLHDAAPQCVLLACPAQAPRPHDRSPLHYFWSQRQHQRTSHLHHGADVAADDVQPQLWAVRRQSFIAAGGLSSAFDAGAEVICLCRRLYAAGGVLKLCAAAAARATPGDDVAAAVGHWRALGRNAVALIEAHHDPHGPQRLRQRLQPYRTLLPGAAALARRLAHVDAALRHAARPQPQAMRQLEASFAQLYAVSALQGALGHSSARPWFAAPAAQARQERPPDHA